MGAIQVAAVIGDEPFERQIDFADQQTIAKLVDHASHAGDDIVHFGEVGGVERHDLLMGRLAGAVVRVRGIVGKGKVFDQMPDDIDAEAVDPLGQPKLEYVMHGVDDFAIPPVQIRLRREEGMVVILACLVVELPGVSSEFRQPIVGRTAVGRGVAPDVPISFRIVLEDLLAMNQGCWSDE